MRNAKLLLLSIVTAVSALGCTIQTRNGVKEVPYDYSDYAYYDRPFNASPDYRSAQAQAEVAPPPRESEKQTATLPRSPSAATAAGMHRTHAGRAGSSLFDAGVTNAQR